MGGEDQEGCLHDCRANIPPLVRMSELRRGYGVKGHLGLDDPHSRSPGSAEKEEHLPCTQFLLPPRAVLGTWLLQSRRNFPLGSVHLPGPHQPVFLCASIVRARQC